MHCDNTEMDIGQDSTPPYLPPNFNFYSFSFSLFHIAPFPEWSEQTTFCGGYRIGRCAGCTMCRIPSERTHLFSWLEFENISHMRISIIVRDQVRITVNCYILKNKKKNKTKHVTKFLVISICRAWPQKSIKKNKAKEEKKFHSDARPRFFRNQHAHAISGHSILEIFSVVVLFLCFWINLYHHISVGNTIIFILTWMAHTYATTSVGLATGMQCGSFIVLK